MSKKLKCQVVFEDNGDVTVRKAKTLSAALYSAVLGHAFETAGGPMELLASVVDMVGNTIGDLGDAQEFNGPERDAFVAAAEAYLEAMEARREARQAEDRHQGCCECGGCVVADDGGCPESASPSCECDEGKVDDRQRLLEEELKAARDGGDMAKGAG